MKITEIRDIITDLLGYSGSDPAKWSGVYTTSTGAKQRAVWVEGSQKTPVDWTVTGLETVISEVPQANTASFLGGGVYYERVWEVRLRRFGGGSIVPFIERMQRHFANSRVRILRGDDLSPEGAVFYVTDSDWTWSYRYGGSSGSVQRIPY